jgi:hypothetical protein
LENAQNAPTMPLFAEVRNNLSNDLLNSFTSEVSVGWRDYTTGCSRTQESQNSVLPRRVLSVCRFNRRMAGLRGTQPDVIKPGLFVSGARGTVPNADYNKR